MRTTRRRFLQLASVGAAAFGRVPALLGAQGRGQRAKLAHRRRQIIFNDDGDDVWDTGAKTPEGFVNVRLKHMLDTQVETLFYCTTQSFNYFTHNTKVGEVFLSREGPFQHNNMKALIDAGTDPLKLAVEYAHRNRIEAVWTLRMNDIHDAFTPPLFPRWKREHPDAVLGKEEDWGKYPAGGQRRWWSGADFEREDVRKRTFDLIDEVARNYDIDAIDLDWLRHPILFQETLSGKPARRKQIELITALVRDVRKMLDEVGEKRGRPILLSTRVPMRINHGLHIGTDVETWLKQDLIDLLTIGGGYVPFSMPTHELVWLGHRHEVPVYPCISLSGMLRRKPYGPGTAYGIEAWRAAAANTFHAKADGLSLFNLFPEPGNEKYNKLVRSVFTEVGDVATLNGKDKLFCLDNAAHMKDCGYINHVVPYQQCLPKPIESGKPLTVTLPVGEDVSSATSLVLRVQTDQQVEIASRLNGRVLSLAYSEAPAKEFGMSWQTSVVEPRVIKKGANTLEVRPTQSVAQSVSLTGLELAVTFG